MTTSGNFPEDTIFFRQIHPGGFNDQILGKNNFQGRNDPERLTPQGSVDTSYFAVSLDIEHASNNAQQSYERHIARKLESTGVITLTKGEITSLGLSVEPRVRQDNPYHWHIIFPEDKNKASTHKKLRDRAIPRGWAYAPPWVLPISLIAKPSS